MNIILNHTLRSIKSNRNQIAIIITTITIVTVMIFVALSISGLFYNINISNQSRLAENMDIGMSGELFPIAKVENFVNTNTDTIEYADYFLQIGGLLQTSEQTKIIMLEATGLQNLYDRYPHKLKAKEVATNAFEYPAIWIGEDFAKELSVSAGETIEIYYEGSHTYQKMSISRIMENKGFFADSAVNNIFIDISSINTWGMVNVCNIKLYNSKDFSKVSQSLKAHMKNDAIDIKSAIDYARVEEIMNNNTRLLNIALIFIMAIMILILFTSYLVVAKNRLNEMIVFKSAGATPIQTTFIMLTEVLLYGVVGAGIGLFIGRIAMGVTAKAIIPNFPNAISYDLWKYVVAFLTGVIVSAVSAILPILRVSKKSIRELTSGIVKDITYTKPLVIVVLTVLLGVAITLLLTINSLVLPMTLAIIGLFAFWLYFVVPYIIRLFSFVFSKIKGQSKLASISIKRNSSTNTLTVLVGVVITFSFIVVTVISLIITAISPYNSRYNADYVIGTTQKMDYEGYINELGSIEGIENIVYYRIAEFEMLRANRIPLKYKVVGIDSSEALLYATKGLNEGDYEVFEDILHPVVINNDMAMRMKIGIGDSFSPSRTKSTANVTYNEKLDYEFTVVGIDYSTTENDRVVYVKIEDMKYNGEMIEFDEEMLFVKAEEGWDNLDLFLTLRDKTYTNENTFVLLFDDWAYATSKGLEGIQVLLRIIQFLVSIVALIGVINLSIVTITDRQKELKVYKTSGMSSRKYLSLSFFEGMIISISGAIIGMALSLFFNQLMPTFANLINKYLVYKTFPVDIPIIAAIAMLVYVAIYFFIAWSNKKSFQRLSYHSERGL